VRWHALPGVQVVAPGQINLRGAGLNRYQVTIDGQRMASTTLDDRGVDLGMLPVDLFRDLEIVKAPGPDSDADAIGGVINLRTWQPVSTGRSVDVTIGGGANTRYFDYTGPASRASIRYSEAISEELGLSVNISHQSVGRSYESIGITYDVADFGDGPVDVIEQISPALHNDGRRTTGGGLQLTYQPSGRAMYHIRGLINHDNRNTHSHLDNYHANGDWIDSQATGAIGSQGVYIHNAHLDKNEVHHYLLTGGARHQFNSFNLEYDLTWSHSGVQRRMFDFPFQRSGLNFDIDMQQRSRSSMTITSQQFLLDDGSIDRRFITMAPFYRLHDDHTDNNFSVKMDITIPHRVGSVKLGSQARLIDISAKHDDRILTYSRNFNMTRFKTLKQRGVEILDQYTMHWLIDQDAASKFLNARLPEFRFDEDQNHLISDIRNFESTEYIYASYAMADFEYNRFYFSGGIRVEITDARYKGINVSFDDSGAFESKSTLTRSHNHLDFFPNVRLGYDPGEQTRLQFGLLQVHQPAILPDAGSF
jgi:TonB-dependent receptor